MVNKKQQTGISVKLPKTLYDKVKTQASAERRSITAVLSMILEATYGVKA